MDKREPDMVMVPREPTEAMIAAAEECGPIGCCNLTPDNVREVWSAMLSALRPDAGGA